MAEPEEFVPFYRQEAAAVLTFFVRRVLDGEAAVELTAETFAQAWRGWGRVRTDSREEMRAWLFTIARRQLSRYLRRGKAQQTAVRRLGIRVPAVHEDDLTAIEQAAAIGQLRLSLGSALDDLSGDQRDALRLRVVEELPYDEVARHLGISEPAARARVSRGLRALQRSLASAAALSEGGA